MKKLLLLLSFTLLFVSSGVYSQQMTQLQGATGVLDGSVSGGSGGSTIGTVPAWNPATAYVVDDLVFYLSSFYKRLVNGTTATPPDSDTVNWVEVSPDGLPLWNAGKAYLLNDMVKYNDHIFVRIIAGTTATDPETDLTNWKRLSIKTLADERIMISAGGEVTEATRLGIGEFLAGDGLVPTIIQGTVNQVNVASATGFYTLSAPQDIHTGASPVFAGADLGNIRVSANTVESLNANGDVIVDPTGTGRFIVNSDMDILGTITQFTQTGLSITNARVTVNDGGTQATADLNGAGLEVSMTDATTATMAYNSVNASKFDIGAEGDLSQIATISHTQSFTNKTIDSILNDVAADRIHFRIRNQTGVLIPKCSVVHIESYNSGADRFNVDLADADDGTKLPAIAMLREDLANNANGKASAVGIIEGCNTSSFNVNDPIYLSTTPGQVTNIRPTGETPIQPLGVVIRSHAAQGAFLFVARPIQSIPNNLTMFDGGAIRTNTQVGDFFTADAYDTDDLQYQSFMTLTANTVPTFELAPTSMTMNGALNFATLSPSGVLHTDAGGTVFSDFVDLTSDVVNQLPASQVSVSPNGLLASTDAQSAFQELDDEKLNEGSSVYHVGVGRRYTTISAALTAIGDATNGTDNKTPQVIYIDGGVYDEDLAIPAGRIVHLVAQGTVILGDGLGANWSSTNSRSITTKFENAFNFDANSPRPALLMSSSIPSDSTTTFMAQAGGWRVSGDLNVAGDGSTHTIVLEAVEINGIVNKTAAGLTNLSARHTYFKGAVNMATATILERCDHCQFSAAVTVDGFNEIRSSEILAGMTVTGNFDTMPPSGMFGVDFSGVFTGPANSFKIDNVTNYFFTLNGASLAGGATKVILEEVDTSSFTGILPIAKGGTNNDVALSNEKVMFSRAGKISEFSPLGVGEYVSLDSGGNVIGQSITGNVNRISVVVTDGDTNLDLPQDIDVAADVQFATATLTGNFQVDGDAVIGGAPADASAVLTINSTSKGLLPPRMTEAQRDAIASPTEGLMIYNSDISQPQYFNGTLWVSY